MGDDAQPAGDRLRAQRPRHPSLSVATSNSLPLSRNCALSQSFPAMPSTADRAQRPEIHL